MHEGTIIAQPRAQIFIKRPRLTKLLDEAGGRILLLLAPAGYGKTTLAREWTGERDGIGWYTGTPAMADVAGLSVGIAETLAEMSDPAPNDMVERVRILAARGHDPRGLAKAVSVGTPGADTLLVVDDYHHAIGSADAESFFEELVALTEFRLLITSRERPSWLGARRVIYGEAAVVDMDALAFTDDEARVVLGSEDAHDLLAEAGGWPAVIGLAAMRGTSDIAAGLPPDDLYRFFAEDLFRSVTPDLRDAMFRFALTGATGVDAAHELLGPARVKLVAEAAERGLLTPGGPQVVHPLLRGFLLAKLAELDPTEMWSYVAQVVKFLAKRKRWDECLLVLEHFPNDELIVLTLRQGLEAIVDSGRIATVRRWVELGRRAGANENPLLMLAEAEAALRQREDSKAQALGEQAGKLLHGDLSARAYIAASRAAHFRDESQSAMQLAEQAISESTSGKTHLNALWTAYNSTVEINNQDAAEIFRRLEALTTSDSIHALRLHTSRGFLLSHDGNVRDALSELGLAAAFMPTVDDPFARTNYFQYLSYMYLLRTRYEESLRASMQLIGEGEVSGLQFAVDHGMLRQIGALIGLRQLGRAQRMIDELRRRTRTDFVEDNLGLHLVRLAIASGDLSRAATLLRGQSRSRRPAFRGELAGYKGIVLASVGDLDGAREALRTDNLGLQFVESTALAQMTRTILAVRTNETDRGLFDSLSLLMEQGNIDALVIACRAYPPLVAHLAARQETRDTLVGVLGRSRDRDIARAGGLQIPRELRPRERLSPREREVYELLAQGRANHEIAKALFISESTTKVHVRHILEKLGVHSRTAAARLMLVEDESP
ncbi:MAG: LuxR C-terminal-related transcriptional regulator [Gaiellaceae bacterium]